MIGRAPRRRLPRRLLLLGLPPVGPALFAVAWWLLGLPLEVAILFPVLTLILFGAAALASERQHAHRAALARELDARRTQRSLDWQIEAHAALLDQTPGFTVLFEDNGAIRSVFGAGLYLLQASTPEAFKGALLPADADHLSRQVQALSSGRLDDAAVRFSLRTRTGQRAFAGELNDQRDAPAVRGIVLRAQDVSVEHRLAEELRGRAQHDPLTGLANRAYLLDAIERQRAGGGAPTLLLLDLDRFKLVNDTLGHHAGDHLLRQIARRLVSAVEDQGEVARLGGDEFTVLLPAAQAEAAVTIAEAIIEAVRTPVDLGGTETIVSVSVGIAHAEADDTPADLLRKADSALYRAKGAGRSRVAVFSAEDDPHTVEELQFEGELRQAAARGEFQLEVQPEVDLGTGRVVGGEALVRWAHPQRGLLPPAAFIGLAEETGEIFAAGDWILGEASRHAARWVAMHHGAFTIAVNLSAREFEDAGLVERVSRVLSRTGLAASCLRLEITESALLSDTPAAMRTLQALADMGIQLALDDFGTGYSSLSYLERLPIHIVKLDRSFVSKLEAPRQQAIVRAVFALARALKLRVVAEGVETPQQLATLRALGCDTAQGHLFAAALPASDFSQLLLRRDQYEAIVEDGESAGDGPAAPPSVEAPPTPVLRDTATGLATDALFRERLAYCWAVAERRNETLAVGVMSLLPRARRASASPEELGEVADALQGTLRATDTVALLADTRFAVIFAELERPLAARIAAERCVRALERLLPGLSERYRIAFGIGTSTPSPGSPDEVFRRATIAFGRAARRHAQLHLHGSWAEIALFDSEIDLAVAS